MDATDCEGPHSRGAFDQASKGLPHPHTDHPVNPFPVCKPTVDCLLPCDAFSDSSAAEETGMEQGTGSSTSQPKVSKTHVAVAGGEDVMKQQESSSSPASQPKASMAPDTSAVGEAVLKQQDGGCSPSSQANVSAACGTGGNDEAVMKQQDSGSSIRSQPNASTTHEKCLSCCRSDGPILRTCKECGGRYHRFCQQDDKDGHYCNLCFKYMGRNTACQKAV